jgi:TonB family protein
MHPPVSRVLTCRPSRGLTMYTFRGSVVVLTTILLFFSLGISQESGKGHTADTLAGTKYFIVIPPVDSTNRDNMPIVSPEGFVEVEVPPVPIKQVAPVYPSESLPRSLRVTVWVKCLIDTTGKVLKAEVMKSNNELFNSVALEAAKQWVFTPARVRGVPVVTWAAIPFHFKGTGP